MRHLILLLASSLLAGCGTVSTVAAVGAATIGVAATAINVSTTAAGVAWDVGKATVSGAGKVTEWAIDATRDDPPATADAAQVAIEPYRD